MHMQYNIFNKKRVAYIYICEFVFLLLIFYIYFFTLYSIAYVLRSKIRAIVTYLALCHNRLHCIEMD